MKCQLLSTYTHFNVQQITYEIPLEDIFILYAFAVGNDPVNRFNGITMVNSPSEREAGKLLNELKEMMKKS